MVTSRHLEQIAQVSAIVLLVAGCLTVLRPFLGAILAAGILCYSTWPIYRWIERSLWGVHWLAALVMTILIVLTLVLPLALIAVAYGDEVPHLVERSREILADGLPGPPDWVVSVPLIGEWLDAAWRELAASRDQLDEALKKMAQPAREFLIQAGIVIADGVLQFTLIAVIGFFFYRDGAALAAVLRRAVNRVAGNLTAGLLQTVGGTVNGVVYGIIGTGIAQGLAAVVGFVIAGVPGPLMLGFLTAILSVIPGGTPLPWIGATVWLFYQDEFGWAIFMGIWGFFVISGIDNVVKPLLISQGSKLPLVLVLLGVFGGILAFGFVGVFLGPALLAVGFNLVRLWADQPPLGTAQAPKLPEG